MSRSAATIRWPRRRRARSRSARRRSAKKPGHPVFDLVVCQALPRADVGLGQTGVDLDRPDAQDLGDDHRRQV